MNDLHVVLGSTGGAGNAIARALHAAGLRVRGVNRSGSADLPEGVELVAADIADPEGAERAVAGATVVYMAAQPAYHRWSQEFRPMLESVVGATASVGAKLVMVDNLYSYGPGSGPMSETTPERATDTKGRVRRECAAWLLEQHRAGRLRVTVGRASDYFGPRGDNSTITALAIEPIAEGTKKVSWMGATDVPHSVAYLPDVASAYVTLGTSDRADGRVWILPHRAPVTGDEFLAAVVAHAPRRTGRISRTMLRLAAPFHRMSRELLGILYQFTEPFVVDDAAFREAFGPVHETPFDEAVAATVASYLPAEVGFGARPTS